MFGVILLPSFALQAALRHRPGRGREPVAILTSDPATKPVVWQVNEQATEAGVQVGMTSSQALARCGVVHLLPRARGQEATVVEALLESAFACSPWVEATAEGVATFELRDDRPDMEEVGRRAVAHLAGLELSAQVGFAQNPDLALLAAHAAAPVLVVTDAHGFLADLPVAALNPSPALSAILHRWGIDTLGALGVLPPEAVARRLGPEGHRLWQRASGHQERLLRLVAPPVTFEEHMDFEYEVQTLDPLLFVLRRFIEQLVLRLGAAYRVPASLTLTLCFDDGQEHRRHFRIPAPTANVETLFRVVHTHLENFTASSPIKSLHLSAQPTVTLHEQFGLFKTALRDPNRFSETLARLYALLGGDGAGVVCPRDTHRPDTFRLEAPDFLRLGDVDHAHAAVDKEPPVLGLPLRRWRPPVPLEVAVVHRFPVSLRSVPVSGQVRAARGPYQLAGGWWERSAVWDSEEWDVELAGDSGLYRVSRRGAEWFLEGAYD